MYMCLDLEIIMVRPPNFRKTEAVFYHGENKKGKKGKYTYKNQVIRWIIVWRTCVCVCGRDKKGVKSIYSRNLWVYVCVCVYITWKIFLHISFKRKSSSFVCKFMDSCYAHAKIPTHTHSLVVSCILSSSLYTCLTTISFILTNYILCHHHHRSLLRIYSLTFPI